MIVILAFAFFMAASILAGAALRDRMLRRQREAIGTFRETTISDSKDGERVCIEGRVHAISFTQSSPFEGMPANVWMRTILEELSRGWILVFDESRKGDFAVEDDDEQRVIVRGPVRLVAAPSEKPVNTDLFDDELPEAVKRASESFAARCQKQILDKEALYRMRLESVSDGDFVTVIGNISHDKAMRCFSDEVILSKQSAKTLLAVPTTRATWVKWGLAILCVAAGLALLRLTHR